MPRAFTVTPAMTERFWSNVRPGPDGCLLWTGRVNRGGYGLLWCNELGRDVLAHRVAMALAGTLVDTLDGLHSCNTPACVSAAHLRPGTMLENQRDSVRAGTHSRPPVSTRKGEAVHFAKLRDDDAAAIRRRAASGESVAALASAYGVGAKSIRNVLRRKTFAHVPDVPGHHAPSPPE